MTASKVTERAQLIAMVESHRDWEQSCGLTSGGKLLSAPTTLIVDVLDAVLRALRELERDVDERSREIGEVMQVNERLAKERDAARQRVAELERENSLLLIQIRKPGYQVREELIAASEERDAARRELEEAREEIGRCNEREAAMEAEAGTWRRDHDRVEYLESLDGEVSLIRWTGRRHGEIKGLGWVLVHDGPGVVSTDVSPTVRAALDRAREGE